MNHIRRSERRVIYYQHAREYFNQLREAERRRRNTLNYRYTLNLTEERMLEVLSNSSISTVDADRIIRSKSTFHSVLSKYSTVSLPTLESLNVKESCTICLAEYVPGKQIRRLLCGHSFHRRCIDRWLPKYLTCPLCRRGILGNHYTAIPELNEMNGSSDDDIPDHSHLSDEEDQLESVVEHATQQELRVDVQREIFADSEYEESDSDEPSPKRVKLNDETDDGAGPSCSREENQRNENLNQEGSLDENTILQENTSLHENTSSNTNLNRNEDINHNENLNRNEENINLVEG